LELLSSCTDFVGGTVLIVGGLFMALQRRKVLNLMVESVHRFGDPDFDPVQAGVYWLWYKILLFMGVLFCIGGITIICQRVQAVVSN